MSMFMAVGQVLNVFKQADYKNRETGEVIPGKLKIQLLGDFPLENGDVSKRLVDFSVENRAYYDKLIGQTIRVPISVFANNNNVVFFIPKGSVPELVTVYSTVIEKSQFDGFPPVSTESKPDSAKDTKQKSSFIPSVPA